MALPSLHGGARPTAVIEPDGRQHGWDLVSVVLGYEVCDQTVGNVVRRHGLAPAPERSGYDFRKGQVPLG